MSQSLETIKPSRDSYTLAEKIVSEELDNERNNTSLKQYYSNLMDQLEIDGIPKEKISTIGSSMVRQKKASLLKLPAEEVSVGSWWFDVARQKGCIDTSYSHGNATDAERENSSINTPFYEENKDIINLILQTRDFYDDAISKLKTQPLTSLLKTDQGNLLKQSLHDWAAHLKIARDIFNEKQKVPSNTIHILLHALATESTINYATIAFFDHYKQILTLTAKQAGKYRKGIVTNMINIFKPATRDIAIFLNYYGLSCENCSSWCVTEETDRGTRTSLKCLDCEHTFEAKTVAKCKHCQIPLYKEELEHIANTWNDTEGGGRCSNCNTINHLPQELLNYASE